ncbi:Protein tweety -like protein 2-like [Takifugu flavidus]|uniref:Protein tweety-like protein 2-like n=1 Tax=Takifugu flavidus TaxID=433684 RepID=A0A5C6PRD2_9TELE|nr:Protein tweety -like protein 2-like [Takifugu flavidus]
MAPVGRWAGPQSVSGGAASSDLSGMSSARVDYIAPWWTYWLHNFPHVNLRFQPVDNSFLPEEENYQQVGGGGSGREVGSGRDQDSRVVIDLDPLVGSTAGIQSWDLRSRLFYVTCGDVSPADVDFLSTLRLHFLTVGILAGRFPTAAV